jgi:hypothetical protein
MGMPVIIRGSMIRPNLFIVGAAKSGTTSLYAGLKSHPEIFLSDPKEPGFFIRPELRRKDLFGAVATEEDALCTYLDLFRAAEGFRYVGDASTEYTMRPRCGDSAEAIHAFAPAARIIYIVRDPVERTISDYWWHVNLGIENRQPLQAISEDPRYCDVSHYAKQIRPYLELFSRQQLWVLTLEEFSRDPAGELDRIFRWLELDPLAASPLCETRENVAPHTIIRYPPWLIEFLHSRPYQSLRQVVPAPARRIVHNLMTTRIVRDKHDMTAIKAILRPRQRRQTEELRCLLGRDFRQWVTLYEECRAAQSSPSARPEATSGDRSSKAA